MRGLAIALMAVDHVDSIQNPHHAQGDSLAWHQRVPLSEPDFLTRWATHFCAPAFVFLAGAGIALSAAAAARRGARPWSTDVHLLARGAVLIALELTYVSFCWRFLFAGGEADFFARPVFLQVIWALGACTIAMAVLRRLPSAALLALAGALLAGCEWFRATTKFRGQGENTAERLLFGFGPIDVGASNGFFAEPDAIVLYSVLPWLPAMLLGFVFGRSLAHDGTAARPRAVAAIGAASLALFALLRWIDGFGNMGLHRRDDSAIEWLHCSKYPPSVTFLAMELGLVLLVLAVALLAQRRGFRLRRFHPLLVLGQVALFFYLLHLPLIRLAADAGLLPSKRDGAWWVSWLGACGVVLATWLPCALYREYKQRFRHAWTRYL